MRNASQEQLHSWRHNPRHDHSRRHHPGFGRPDFGAQGFGPGWGPRGNRRANRGDVRWAILSLLNEIGPSNGYSLIKAIAEKTGGTWRPSPGSVYPTLQQLVDEELVESTGDGRKTAFALTDRGVAYVGEHSDELTKAWDSAQPDGPEAEFAASVMKLMGVLQQFRFGATDEQRSAATTKLDETRRELYRILAD